MAKVTAIVSAYYADKYLAGRIENLLSQSLRPEIVVICQEGSPEVDILLEYPDIDNCIVISMDKPVPTLYEAWNMGIRQASGKYITTANCDDRFYPKAIEKMAKALDDHPEYAMAYTNIDVVEQIDGAPVQKFEWAEGGVKELLFTGCFLGPMPMWRKSLHEKHGYFLERETLRNGDEYKYQIVSDYEYWMRLAKGGEKFYHIKEVLGAYLRHGSNLEHKFPLRRMWEDARVRSKYRMEFEPIP